MNRCDNFFARHFEGAPHHVSSLLVVCIWFLFCTPVIVAMYLSLQEMEYEDKLKQAEARSNAQLAALDAQFQAKVRTLCQKFQSKT